MTNKGFSYFTSKQKKAAFVGYKTQTLDHLKSRRRFSGLMRTDFFSITLTANVWRKPWCGTPQDNCSNGWCQMVLNGLGSIFLIYTWSVSSVDICVAATCYLHIVADHVYPFIAIIYPDGHGYFQQDNAPCHRARIF